MEQLIVRQKLNCVKNCITISDYANKLGLKIILCIFISQHGHRQPASAVQLRHKRPPRVVYRPYFCHAEKTGALWLKRNSAPFSLWQCHNFEQGWDEIAKPRSISKSLECCPVCLMPTKSNHFIFEDLKLCGPMHIRVEWPGRPTQNNRRLLIEYFIRHVDGEGRYNTTYKRLHSALMWWTNAHAVPQNAISPKANTRERWTCAVAQK